MMRWAPETVAEVSDDRDDFDAKGLLQDALVAVASIGTRPLIVAAAVALIVLTLAVGMTMGPDAVAGGRWCPVQC